MLLPELLLFEEEDELDEPEFDVEAEFEDDELLEDVFDEVDDDETVVGGFGFATLLFEICCPN